MIMILGSLSALSAFFFERAIEILSVNIFIFLILLVPSCVELILPFFQNELCTLLHGQINSLLPCSFNFLDSILFTLKYLFSLDYLAARVFHHKVLNSIVGFHRLLRLHKSPLISTCLVACLALRRLMRFASICNRVDRSEGRVSSSWRVVHICHAMRVTLSFILSFLGHKYEFSQIIVRLSQVKRFWLLSSIVPTAPLRFKDVFLRRVEIVWVVRGASFKNWVVCRLRSSLQFRPQGRRVFSLNYWGALRHGNSG